VPASFFTLMAHPVNILMIGPANYTFRDFLRAGWQLTAVCFVMLIVGLLISETVGGWRALNGVIRDIPSMQVEDGRVIQF
jgi:hypothetical protein